MHLSGLLIACVISITSIAQTSYFVDQQSGNDSNNGLTNQTAFQTFDAATSVVTPGDSIVIMGVYHNASYNPNFSYSNNHDAHLWHSENSIRINNLHGTPGAYITITSYDENTQIKGDGGNIFRVQNSSYIRISNLEIVGEVDNIPLSTANQLQFVYIDANTVVNPLSPTASDIQYRDQDCVSNCVAGTVAVGEVYTNLSGMDVRRPSYVDTRGIYLSKVDHIDLLNNHIHHMPGGGLRVSDCEDINIIGNEVNDCSRKSYSGTHGLVVTKATSTRTDNDYRIYIQRNKVHHNYNEQFSWAPTKVVITPHIDEGKGISLQRNETTYDGSGAINVNWEHGRILVENNLCYFNGFSGIHSNDGNRIDFINNTCYFNSYTKSITEGITSNNGGNIGISAQGGSDIRIFNNISVIDAGLSKSAISSNISANDGLIVEDNIIYGTSQAGITSFINENANVASIQVNTQMADPLFVDPVNFNFRLKHNSPAVGIANNHAPTNDYSDATRDANPDLGALEYCQTSAIDVQSACESFTWIDGNTYTSSNSNAQDTLTSSLGCDSIVTLNLTIESLSASASLNNSTLSASPTGTNYQYQWIDCTNGNQAIAGATSDTYTPQSNGDYAVIVSGTNCTDTSECRVVDFLSLEDLNMEGIVLYPNPNNGSFQLRFEDHSNIQHIIISDMQGKVIHKLVNIIDSPLSIDQKLSKGLYQVVIFEDDQTQRLKFVVR